MTFFRGVVVVAVVVVEDNVDSPGGDDKAVEDVRLLLLLLFLPANHFLPNENEEDDDDDDELKDGVKEEDSKLNSFLSFVVDACCRFEEERVEFVRLRRTGGLVVVVVPRVNVCDDEWRLPAPDDNDDAVAKLG